MRCIEGTSVIVTGGGSGLGEATASHLARRGARVTICGQRPEKARSVAESIGPNCAWLEADIDDPDDRARIIDTAVERGGSIDVIVNNAGNRYAAPLAEIEEERLADHAHPARPPAPHRARGFRHLHRLRGYAAGDAPAAVALAYAGEFRKSSMSAGTSPATGS